MAQIAMNSAEPKRKIGIGMIGTGLSDLHHVGYLKNGRAIIVEVADAQEPVTEELR